MLQCGKKLDHLIKSLFKIKLIIYNMGIKCQFDIVNKVIDWWYMFSLSQENKQDLFENYQ